MNDLENIRKTFSTKLSSIASREQLHDLEIEFLGRKGKVNQLFSKMKGFKGSEMKSFGQGINALKTEIENALKDKWVELKPQGIDIDTSIPGNRPRLGHLHPTTQIIREINTFFRYHGYSVYEGPEIETSEYNFERLNLPEDHPARDLQDTLYIKEPTWLLRTHTSSVEARALTSEKPPLRIVVPGKVYRNETANATNNSFFYQYQGVCVDRDLSMADLLGTLTALARFLYGDDVKTRVRCKYYPEVEPGAGLDIQCNFCQGDGCQVCKYRGWIEVLGSGMIHPNIFRSCRLDPDKWSGFAFGLGLDRLVMLKYGINDVRRLYNGSLVFKDALL